MEHVYCPKCGCNRLSVDCLTSVLLDFTDAAEPQMQQFDGWDYHGEDPHVECADCHKEGKLSAFTHTEPWVSRAERQMRNMEEDATAVLQARDEEIARLRETLRAVLPYAHSRGEDMHEQVRLARVARDGDRDNVRDAWKKCDDAVTEAYKLLGEKP